MNYTPIRTLYVNPQTGRFVLDKGGLIPEGPAIYGIQNLQTKKIYIGQSVDALRRIRNEMAYCRNGSGKPAEVALLRQAWLNPSEGETAFCISIFYEGDAWFLEETRRAKEKEMIEHFLQLGLSYNMLSDDRFQPGMRAFAHDSENESKRRKAIQQSRKGKVPAMVQSGKNKSETPRDPSSTKPKPVSIDGTVYDSVNVAAKALDLNRQTVKKRCDSGKPEFSTWFFLETDNP